MRDRYPSGVQLSRAMLLLLPVCLLLGAADPPREIRASVIAEETQRSHKVERHVMSFWWLPVEYWVAAARELKLSEETIDRAGELLRDYVVIGIVDAEVQQNGRFKFASLRNANERLFLIRNGKEVVPVERIDPAVERILPELAYFLTTSLGPLSSGLRLALYPNIDPKGRPIMGGSSQGTLVAKYRPEGAIPISLIWRSPLTSVAGSHICPRGGEDLDASWNYCPWHGVPVEK